jgi:hypothetical protein
LVAGGEFVTPRLPGGQVPETRTWAFARDNNLGGDPHDAINRDWCTVYVTSLDFQDTYWNENPFRQIIDDAQQTGVVHRSRLRVSQHLCAPLLNPNRRIGCSAPLNYDSLHLPPELRDFRIELRDIDFSFLPGNTEKATLEPLTIYEFNGGNQVPGTQNALLYMPHFRSFQTTTVSQAFKLDVFSPYGNPSYICLFARSKLRPAEYIKQPLIKTLTIKSNTTMKKSNTVLDAREHELFHLSQRNVHPRAEYTRISNQKRQVVLLCAGHRGHGHPGVPEGEARTIRVVGNPGRARHGHRAVHLQQPGPEHPQHGNRGRSVVKNTRATLKREIATQWHPKPSQRLSKPKPCRLSRHSTTEPRF